MLKTHDSAPRAGREGGIEMLNCEGCGAGRSCRPSRSPEVKRSSTTAAETSSLLLHVGCHDLIKSCVTLRERDSHGHARMNNSVYERHARAGAHNQNHQCVAHEPPRDICDDMDHTAQDGNAIVVESHDLVS